MTNELLAPGNWVLYNKNQIQLKMVNANLVWGNGGPYSLSEISGIPITPELLEKGGFGNSGDGVYIHIDLRVSIGFHDGVLLRVNTGLGWFFLVANKIQYIHQLQNLIHILTGKPWDIKM